MILLVYNYVYSFTESLVIQCKIPVNFSFFCCVLKFEALVKVDVSKPKNLDYSLFEWMNVTWKTKVFMIIEILLLTN